MIKYAGMPKVSKNPLSKETRDEMLRAFFGTLAKISDVSLLERFLNDLLTPAEKLMISKRLMVAVLLQRGYSYGAICRVLKMSKTTVHIIQRELLRNGAGHRKVFEMFFKESKGQRLLAAIERFLSAITLPVKYSPSSPRRWKRLTAKL